MPRPNDPNSTQHGSVNRRDFLAGSAGAVAALGAGVLTTPASAEPTAVKADGPKKACLFGMLPGRLSIEDRFKLARDVGFEGVESSPIGDPAECERMRKGAESAGIRVHSVIYGGWDPPLTHPDPAAQQRSFKNAVAALHSAKLMGADDILLVPGVVNAETRYQDAYKRSQEHIRRLIPHAADLKVQILVEEVWNNFLLSPMEFASYIDSFKSPWVQAYFDVGNVVAFAWPEDWIRTLGKRIKKVHLKDYKGGPGLFGSRKGDFVNLRDGSINWPEVRKAFAEVGFTGFMTTELGGGDEAYLRDVAARVDKIFAGV
jgi:L-ribulose-5-phosphate 3-epimerase